MSRCLQSVMTNTFQASQKKSLKQWVWNDVTGIRRGCTYISYVNLFIGDLLTAMSVAQTRCRRIGLVANTRLEMMSKELSVVNVKWYCGISLQGVRKNRKYRRQEVSLRPQLKADGVLKAKQQQRSVNCSAGKLNGSLWLIDRSSASLQFVQLQHITFFKRSTIHISPLKRTT